MRVDAISPNKELWWVRRLQVEERDLMLLGSARVEHVRCDLVSGDNRGAQNQHSDSIAMKGNYALPQYYGNHQWHRASHDALQVLNDTPRTRVHVSTRDHRANRTVARSYQHSPQADPQGELPQS